MRAKPTNLKILEGNRGRRPIRGEEPKPLFDDAPEPPADLSPDALEEWQFVVPELNKMGLAVRLDRTLCAQYTECVSRWRQAERLVKAEGMLVTTHHGNRIPHPAIGIGNVARRDALRFMLELGLTPAARSQMEASRRDDDGIRHKYFGG